MIQTVLGEIKESELGVCSSHEHIFIDMRGCVDVTGNEGKDFYEPVRMSNLVECFSNPYGILDNAYLSGIDAAVEEMLYFKEYGGDTVIDVTLDEIGRDPEALREVSKRSGVNIVLGCGHYYQKAHFPTVKDASVDSLCEEMMRDILVGIGKTGIRSGVIGEIGTSAVMTDDEKKVLRAAGIASKKTGKAIHVHTDLYTENGYEIVDILTREGASPDKICIDHVDVKLRPNYIRDLLGLGVYVEFDDFGKEFFSTGERRFAYDLERIELLKTLIDEGFAQKILVCNDICLKTMWKRFGGKGYAHILRDVRDMAIWSGIGEDVYNSILTDNVRRFLA